MYDCVIILSFILFFIDVEATDAWDRLFSHCLAAVITGFSNQLLLAAKGHLNHATEFVKDSATASQQWLDFIAARGVLVCFKSLFHLSMVSTYTLCCTILNVIQKKTE